MTMPKMPSSEQCYPHDCVHDAYRETKSEGKISTHDEHRSEEHHKTMDDGEHKGMPHHVNKP
jgi:hypothetical protein